MNNLLPRVNRALEIAQRGGLGVVFIAPPRALKVIRDRINKGGETPQIRAFYMKPCPCGYFTDPKSACRCTPAQIQRHLTKEISKAKGFDMSVEVPALEYCLVQEGAFDIFKQIKIKPLKVDYNGNELLKYAIVELGLNIRAYKKVVKIAEVIANAEGQEIIKAEHISEAIGYRTLDRNIWLS